MPDDVRGPDRSGAAQAAQTEGRFDRARIIAFLTDGPSEDALREGLAEATPEGIDIRRGGVRAAINAFRRNPSPQTLIVDLSGEDHPLTALRYLSEVVEPDVRVLVLGDAKDVDFYRVVTRDLGVIEYLPKPVTRESIARHFGPLLTGSGRDAEALSGGRVVTITGACGGVGATTLAANLAWHFAADARRHTVLLDSDLYLGAAAMMLNVKAGAGLRTALESPERIDRLFVERVAQPAAAAKVAGRLHVLAGEESLDAEPNYAADAAPRLLEELRRRYSLVIADVPFAPDPLRRGLLWHSHQRVIVLEPSLAAVRDTLRLLQLARGPQQARRPVIVLNRLGRPGGLSRREIEEALKVPLDVVIPDLPRLAGQAATMGDPAVQHRGAFRNGVIEVAKLVAFVPLLDTSRAASEAIATRRWRLPRGWRR